MNVNMISSDKLIAPYFEEEKNTGYFKPNL